MVGHLSHFYSFIELSFAEFLSSTVFGEMYMLDIFDFVRYISLTINFPFFVFVSKIFKIVSSVEDFPAIY